MLNFNNHSSRDGPIYVFQERSKLWDIPLPVAQLVKMLIGSMAAKTTPDQLVQVRGDTKSDAIRESPANQRGSLLIKQRIG
jgi:hypothetical protein